MNKKKIDEIILIANKILKKYKKKISKKDINVSLYNERYFDSLDFVTFISLIEKKFKIKFKVNDLDVTLSIVKISKLIK
tara:strand:+ start:368 stop:604 length:237 start_codon:yes stop_codon:yes gene_type:complete